MSTKYWPRVVLTSMALVLETGACSRTKEVQQPPPLLAGDVKVNWDRVVTVSKTTPTLQVVPNAQLRRGSRIHDPAFQALKELGADDVRYAPWVCYPKLGVAELEPPKDGKTSWDFSLIDPIIEDFMNATSPHPVVINFSTIPEWMLKIEKPTPYPADPDQVTWDYEKGTELRDSSLKEAADYYARLVSWYTQGGFTDEFGKRHASGHHYKIDYWKVLNEIEMEHQMTPETYTRVYDAVVEAIHRVDPRIRFIGHDLAGTAKEYFEYFLNHKNHKPGIPIDMISYHFYARPTPDQTPEVTQYTCWEQADHFLEVVEYIQNIRARLSPETQTDVDELGTISANDHEHTPGGEQIPNSYWNLSGSMYAYLYAELAKRGVEVAGVSQLDGYPTQYPSVSMVDWSTGQPNARFWVLKLLHDNFGPGDKMVDTHLDCPYVYAQAFLTPQGQRRLLVLSKRDRPFSVSISGSQGAEVSYVDQTTGFQPPASASLTGNQLTLRGFEVAVVNLSK